MDTDGSAQRENGTSIQAPKSTRTPLTPSGQVELQAPNAESPSQDLSEWHIICRPFLASIIAGKREKDIRALVNSTGIRKQYISQCLREKKHPYDHPYHLPPGPRREIQIPDSLSLDRKSQAWYNKLVQEYNIWYRGNAKYLQLNEAPAQVSERPWSEFARDRVTLVKELSQSVEIFKCHVQKAGDILYSLDKGLSGLHYKAWRFFKGSPREYIDLAPLNHAIQKVSRALTLGNGEISNIPFYRKLPLSI